MSHTIAMLSVHTSPLDSPGRTKDAGGMNVYIRELATELGRRGNLVDIFTRQTHERIPRIVQLAPNVRVIHIHAGPKLSLHKNSLFPYIPSFVAQITTFAETEARHYDILHSHYWLSGIAGVQLAWRWDIPHVTMFHTFARLKQLAHPDAQEPQQRLDTEQHLLQSVDRVIAATTDERTQMMRYCGATMNRVQVIPCGVDLELFVPYPQQQARAHLGLDMQLPIVLFAGRLDPFKGPDILLRAASMMEEQAQIVVVGGSLTEDKDLQSLRVQASELNIEQRVQFLGAQPQHVLPYLFSAADVTVVPSYHESFGLVAVESLACGTPVVATRAGGLTTIVRNDVNGYLVPRCPGFFAERLDALLRIPKTKTRLQREARRSVLQFSWQSVANQMEDVYTDLVSAPRTAALLS
ncbi:MAG: glycosyltransferase [Ktedonobacteraceae bacterium]